MLLAEACPGLKARRGASATANAARQEAIKRVALSTLTTGPSCPRSDSCTTPRLEKYEQVIFCVKSFYHGNAHLSKEPMEYKLPSLGSIKQRAPELGLIAEVADLTPAPCHHFSVASLHERLGGAGGWSHPGP